MRLTFKTGRLAVILAGVAASAAFAVAPARADVVGEMSCNVSGGEGAVIVSQRAVACTFHSGEGPAQLYTGYMNRLGVDIGNQTGAVITYNVLAIGEPAPGSLAGDYIGPGFGVTAGNGGGINVLVGGGNSFTLQPISATTSTGVNFNAGVGELHLTFQALEPVAGPRVHRRFHHFHHRIVRRHHHHG
jgi:hypothetical protein